MSRVLYKANCSFGYVVYRAIRRKGNVVIQSSNRGARWRDMLQMSAETFEVYADQYDLYNPYNNDPAVLLRIAERLR